MVNTVAIKSILTVMWGRIGREASTVCGVGFRCRSQYYKNGLRSRSGEKNRAVLWSRIGREVSKWSRISFPESVKGFKGIDRPFGRGVESRLF